MNASWLGSANSSAEVECAFLTSAILCTHQNRAGDGDGVTRFVSKEFLRRLPACGGPPFGQREPLERLFEPQMETEEDGAQQNGIE